MTTDRIESTTGAFAEAARRAGMIVTGDGRISESDAAELLGLSAGHLRNLRTEGAGPPSFRAGINGSRVSYRISDLAAWIEARRDA